MVEYNMDGNHSFHQRVATLPFDGMLSVRKKETEKPLSITLYNIIEIKVGFH